MPEAARVLAPAPPSALSPRTRTSHWTPGPGAIEVRLTSTKPLAAAPATPTVTVHVGTKVMPFAVTTNPVTVVTKPAIKATANGVTKSKALVVNPAP
jgi:hypothetical protein